MVQSNETTKADIIIPSEHTNGVREIVLGHHFAKLTQFKSVYFISGTKKTKTTQLIYTLFTSALKSWPLFVIALLMAVCAGIIIWLAVGFLSDQTVKIRVLLLPLIIYLGHDNVFVHSAGLLLTPFALLVICRNDNFDDRTMSTLLSLGYVA